MQGPTLDHNIAGAAAALLSAAAWALGPVLFRRISGRVSPLGINLGKGILGMLYLGLILVFMDRQYIPARAFLLLAMSGVLGIALGDTFFFMGLARIGARLAVLMESLCPVTVVILAVLFLGERPSVPVWCGIILTITGVTWVLWEKACRDRLKENWGKGVKYGVLSVTFTSLGIICAKVGVSSVMPIQGAFIRLVFGTMGLFLWGVVGFRAKEWLSPLADKRVFPVFAGAVFTGVCVGLVFSFMALKYTSASIAVPLNSTSPLFVLPMAAFAFGEKISARSVLGAVTAVCGISLIFLNI